jgi:hypothetical protein
MALALRIPRAARDAAGAGAHVHRAERKVPMGRRAPKSSMNTTTDRTTAAPKELDAFLCDLQRRVANAEDDTAGRAAFARALEDADAALQLEYIRYPDGRAGDSWLDAYNNVQQVLAFALDPQQPPEFVKHDEGDTAYVVEVERLAKVVERVLVERPRGR